MPRPPRGDEPAVVAISVRVTESQRCDLEQVARDNRSNVSDVIRDAVHSYVADYRDARVFRSTKPLGLFDNPR